MSSTDRLGPPEPLLSGTAVDGDLRALEVALPHGGPAPAVAPTASHVEPADRSSTAPAAWRRLFDSHFDDLYRLAVRSGLDSAEAEDVTQKALIRAYGQLRHVGPADPVRNVRAWLRGITIRVCSEHRRWARVRQLAAALLGATEAARAAVPSPDDDLERTRDRARVGRVLGRMSPKLREVLVLSDLHDCEQREVAEALGIPENTVRSRRIRAREQFRALWAEEEP